QPERRVEARSLRGDYTNRRGIVRSVHLFSGICLGARKLKFKSARAGLYASSPGFDQGIDAFVGIAGLAQNFARVLAEAWRMATVLGLGLGPLRGHGERLDAALARVLDRLQVADR